MQTNRYLAIALIAALGAPGGLGAQQAQPVAQAGKPDAPMAPLPMVQDLKVRILAGQNEMNDLERRVMAPLVVEVRDQNDRIIEGAEVVFRFPADGPGAAFAGGKLSQTSKTNLQGQAAATGWIANGKVGRFEVKVTASFANQMGQATVSMTNVTRITDAMEKKKQGKKRWWSSRKVKLLTAAAVAGAITGIVLARRGGGGPAGSTAPTVVISPGPGVIGAR